MNTVVTPDFRNYPLQPAVVDTVVENSFLRVHWGDGQCGRFHLIWLRDNAADELSIDAHSRERLFDILDIPADIKPNRVWVESGVLVIDWHDRISHYHPGWLRAHCYDLGIRHERRNVIETWDGSMAERLPRFNAEDISCNENSRLEWLQAIRRFGIALVSDSPCDPQDYTDWLEKLLLIRDMNWGKHFDVYYQPDGEYISNKGN